MYENNDILFTIISLACMYQNEIHSGLSHKFVHCKMCLLTSSIVCDFCNLRYIDFIFTNSAVSCPSLKFVP